MTEDGGDDQHQKTFVQQPASHQLEQSVQKSNAHLNSRWHSESQDQMNEKLTAGQGMLRKMWQYYVGFYRIFLVQIEIKIKN